MSESMTKCVILAHRTSYSNRLRGQSRLAPTCRSRFLSAGIENCLSVGANRLDFELNQPVNSLERNVISLLTEHKSSGHFLTPAITKTTLPVRLTARRVRDERAGYAIHYDSRKFTPFCVQE
jgi:hypothetical protein